MLPTELKEHLSNIGYITILNPSIEEFEYATENCLKEVAFLSLKTGFLLFSDNLHARHTPYMEGLRVSCSRGCEIGVILANGDLLNELDIIPYEGEHVFYPQKDFLLIYFEEDCKCSDPSFPLIDLTTDIKKYFEKESSVETTTLECSTKNKLFKF